MSCQNKRGIAPQLEADPNLWFPNNLTREINRVLPSIIEVAAILEYQVEEYIYELINGKYIRDPNSPVGYRLKPGNAGIIQSKTSTKAFGAGLVIGKSLTENLILTSRHIVVQRDTITDYIYLMNRYTDIPRTRAILIRNDLGIRGQNNILRPASIMASNAKMDLALITVARKDYIGKEYNGDVLVNFAPVSGQFAVAIGYPDEMIQIAMGFTASAPYPGNFSLGIHGDFGFSGGPIFLFDPAKGLLLIGIGKSIPGQRLFYVTPDSSLRFKTRLNTVDIPNLMIDEMPMLAPHRIYGVRIEYVLQFLRENLGLIERRGFRLTPAFFKAVRKVESTSK
ncbi:MAG: hypothetical protein Q9P14_18750 [candidate division KSB1 bacterium]|nr:hypothetical protein [candidate division KSB1 bacterium]